MRTIEISHSKFNGVHRKSNMSTQSLLMLLLEKFLSNLLLHRCLPVEYTLLHSSNFLNMPSEPGVCNSSRIPENVKKMLKIIKAEKCI